MDDAKEIFEAIEKLAQRVICLCVSADSDYFDCEWDELVYCIDPYSPYDDDD